MAGCNVKKISFLSNQNLPTNNLPLFPLFLVSSLWLLLKNGVSVFFGAIPEILEHGEKLSTKPSFVKTEQTQFSQLFLHQISEAFHHLCGPYLDPLQSLWSFYCIAETKCEIKISDAAWEMLSRVGWWLLYWCCWCSFWRNLAPCWFWHLWPISILTEH